MRDPDEKDPEREPNQPQAAAPSTARERVLQHLLTTAKTLAVTTAGLALAATGPVPGGRDEVSVESPTPQPAASPAHHPAVCDPLPPPASTPVAPKHRPPVCDPMPPPLSCDVAWTPEYLKRFLSHYAQVVKAPGGPAVEITVDSRSRAGGTTFAIGGEPRVENGKIVDVARTTTSLKVRAVPKRGASEMALVFVLSCQGRKASLKLVVGSGSGTKVPLTRSQSLVSRFVVEEDSRK